MESCDHLCVSRTVSYTCSREDYFQLSSTETLPLSTCSPSEPTTTLHPPSYFVDIPVPPGLLPIVEPKQERNVFYGIVITA
jgi:hypothetical protein